MSLSSDFIAGFCGETEEDHLQTLSLIREVGYNVGFLFAYSMRKVSPWSSTSETPPVHTLTVTFLGTGYDVVVIRVLNKEHFELV